MSTYILEEKTWAQLAEEEDEELENQATNNSENLDACQPNSTKSTSEYQPRSCNQNHTKTRRRKNEKEVNYSKQLYETKNTNSRQSNTRDKFRPKSTIFHKLDHFQENKGNTVEFALKQFQVPVFNRNTQNLNYGKRQEQNITEYVPKKKHQYQDIKTNKNYNTYQYIEKKSYHSQENRDVYGFKQSNTNQKQGNYKNKSIQYHQNEIIYEVKKVDQKSSFERKLNEVPSEIQDQQAPTSAYETKNDNNQSETKENILVDYEKPFSQDELENQQENQTSSKKKVYKRNRQINNQQQQDPIEANFFGILSRGKK